MSNRSVIVLIAQLIVLLLAPNVVFSQAPYPASSTIDRVEFDFQTHRRLAPGSDNWPVTWSRDGNLYSAWGDGGGFGGTNSAGRVKLGVARISGDANNYQATNVWGGFQTEHAATFDGKSYGILSVDGVLYMWVAAQPARHMESCRIAWSTDEGASWTLADWGFHFDDRLSVPTFLNFGQDYRGARDHFVYSYFIHPQWGPDSLPQTEHGFDVHKPGKIYLARVPKSQIRNRSGYEFFSGVHAGQPLWTSDLKQRQAVFKDPNGVGWNVSVGYNAGLKRYLLCTEHSETHTGHFGLFDAPEPWGPWTTVSYEQDWGRGQIEVSTFFWNFTQKWISDDGRRFTMIFTGKNSNDSWNTVNGEFVIGQ
ncbi:DUF4185 domain-containing protein [Stieleria sp. TO1_6]|uniref:DUF4185 domain-containing protein n=1 Tax=Stieleria tagensis TaxID=2956795 RepID=UPI00209AF496|nr:DUF4185 domain-containing protein [Stieleria tagensis]MCO8124772.1 DUF4185 domain-containing protein [Stieleria tagensis]